MKATTSIFIRRIGDKPSLNMDRKNLLKSDEKAGIELYGLDLNFLREIGKFDLIEVKICANIS